MTDAEVTGGVADLVRNGGTLCLDYINTVEPRTGPVSREWLNGYADLVEWARHGGLFDEAAARALLRAAADRRAEAQTAFHTAIDLREGLFRVFAAIVQNITPRDEDLEVLRRAFSEATQHGRLVPHAGKVGWTWDVGVSPAASGGGPVESLDPPWWPVAASAVELLTHGPLDRIKQCPTDVGCSWFFLDNTKNRNRRWCSMGDCGNQIKARRQTDRRRADRRRTGT